MRRIIVFLVLFVFVISLASLFDDAFAAWGKKKDAEEEDAKGKVVCRFKNDEKMTEFEQLYVSKQATFGRMGVLQAYFAMEQNNLTQIDKQMEEKFGFKMDPNKMYDLNRDSREIREIAPVTPPAQQ